jgi:hypothetical protein
MSPRRTSPRRRFFFSPREKRPGYWQVPSGRDTAAQRPGPSRPWQQPEQQSKPVVHAWPAGSRQASAGVKGGAQQRRVGASGLQKVPAVWHASGAEAMHGPEGVQVRLVPQHPLQQFELAVQLAPVGRHSPPSRLTG